MTFASSKFNAYREAFSVRSPDLSRKGCDDELQDVSDHDDVFSLLVAPMEPFNVGIPPKHPSSSGEQMYLWLIKSDDVNLAVERGVSGKATMRGRLAHTNLSGGSDAHAGGELWFKDGGSIYLTGGSSRYAPRSCSELNAIVNAFMESGYDVKSCGWDDETDTPARFFRN